jgi:hypothetical protein
MECMYVYIKLTNKTMVYSVKKGIYLMDASILDKFDVFF